MRVVRVTSLYLSLSLSLSHVMSLFLALSLSLTHTHTVSHIHSLTVSSHTLTRHPHSRTQVWTQYARLEEVARKSVEQVYLLALAVVILGQFRIGGSGLKVQDVLFGGSALGIQPRVKSLWGYNPV